MLKLVLFVAGLVVGAGGAISWLISTESTAPQTAEPEVVAAVPVSPSGGQQALVEDLKTRLAEAKVRFQEAWLQGERAGAETEQRLRRELEAYRKNPSHPAVS